jgi:hypothetical protein
MDGCVYMHRVERLANGVQVEFKDATNRYYGDYHRVNIEVILRFAADNYKTPHKLKILERMGVSGDDVSTVQAQLINSFSRGTLNYLANESFPDKFIQSLKQSKNILLPGLK